MSKTENWEKELLELLEIEALIETGERPPRKMWFFGRNRNVIRKLKHFIKRVLQKQREEIFKELGSYNVAFCNRCKCLFKTFHNACETDKERKEHGRVKAICDYVNSL